VIAGAGGTLKNVVVYVSSGAPEETAPPAEPISITQKGCRFAPQVVAMQVNQEVRVTNEDSTSHNIHPLPTINREWNKAQPPGTPPLEEAFAREAFIPVKCNIHSWMRSYFVVLKTSHYSLSGENGAFTLGNLPPGKYTVTAWHEVYGKQSQEVTVSANETQVIKFTFKAN
jgi:plastocyanin